MPSVDPKRWLLDKRYQPPLSITIAIDVALRRLDGSVTSQQLDVAQRAACLVNRASRSRNESSTPRVRRASFEPKFVISAAEPDNDAHRCHRAAALGSNEGAVPLTPPPCIDEGLSELWMNRN